MKTFIISLHCGIDCDCYCNICGKFYSPYQSLMWHCHHENASNMHLLAIECFCQRFDVVALVCRGSHNSASSSAHKLSRHASGSNSFARLTPFDSSSSAATSSATPSAIAVPTSSSSSSASSSPLSAPEWPNFRIL